MGVVGGFMMIGKNLARLIVLALLGAVSTSGLVTRGAETPASSAAARNLLADALVQDARTRLRDSRLPPALAARQACALLQAANLLDPSDLVTLRLLADAARATRQPTVLRDALRQTLKLDPANLVAQVEYLDLVALSSQALEERARIYQAAMDKTSFDPQVRSEMAVRLATIYYERGDAEASATLLKAALQLNDVNVSALQGLAKLSSQGKSQERLSSLANLLAADPYQPEAWLAGARVLASANLHGNAADWFIIAIEQSRLDGVTPPADVYLDLATELAIAGRRNEAEPLVRQLSSLPDAPLSSILLAQACTQEFPPREPGPATSTAPATQPQDMSARLLEKLAADVKADPRNPRVLADSLTMAAALLADPGPDFSIWLETYRGLVPADDKALASVEGWRFLRSGKFDLARERLLSCADQDMLCQIGLARACAALHQAEEARKRLQDVYNGHPTGLAAILVAQTSRLFALHLTETALSKETLELTKRIPPANFSAHRQPRDLVLVTASLNKRRYSMGEPILLTIKQSNTAEHALPVGSSGVVRTLVGVTGSTRGLGARSLGLFATGDSLRTYRLEKHATLQYEIRVDQGLLADIIEMNPIRSFTVGLTLLIAPRGTAADNSVGLGGQIINVSDVEKSGVAFRSMDEVNKAVAALRALPQEQQMLSAWTLGVALSGIPEPAAQPADAPPPEGAADLAALRTNLSHALTALAASESPTMVAWMLRMTPQTGIPPELAKTLDKLPAAGESAPPFTNVARMMWAERRAAIADAEGGPDRAAAIDRLKELAVRESDPLVQEWFGQLVEALNLPGSTTAPGVKDPRADLQITPTTQTSRTRSDPRVTPPTATPPSTTQPRNP
jgi:tetratricopeptide (TPR) repeat protein